MSVLVHIVLVSYCHYRTDKIDNISLQHSLIAHSECGDGENKLGANFIGRNIHHKYPGYGMHQDLSQSRENIVTIKCPVILHSIVPHTFRGTLRLLQQLCQCRFLQCGADLAVCKRTCVYNID